jgi:hypothetical protein
MATRKKTAVEKKAAKKAPKKNRKKNSKKGQAVLICLLCSG